MCGIAGVFSKDGAPVSESVLWAMGDVVAHRGPDAKGGWANGPVGLSHRRLSIIDLSTDAAQPMRSLDGRLTVVFNGEIYNFRELRTQLETKGFVFRTRSDTEVILAAWLAWGTAAIARLDGMFAIALYDSETQTLLLARDRTGKKPLFVYEDDRRLVFASEIKSILAVPGVDRSADPAAVPQFLTHGYVPTPGTFYRRVRKLAPGTWELHQREKKVRAGRYWDFPVGPERRVQGKRGLAEVEAEVRRLFFAAVKRRMVADVPLGAFLSGGLDSSLVVAAMASLSTSPVQTFSIGFEGHPDWDETGFARLVADRYRTEHTEFKVRPESFELVERLAWNYDEPFGDSSAIPTFIVSSLTRQKVTVALTGDGGDELFAGYLRFAAASWAELVPAVVRRSIGLVAERLPRGVTHESHWERLRRAAARAAPEIPERLRGWTSFFSEEDLTALLRPEVRQLGSPDVLGRAYRDAFYRSRAGSTLNQVLYANAKTYLLDDLNVKMDRASMAASIETRAPFLDTDLMDFAFSLPADLKYRRGVTKWILRRAMGDLVPPAVIHRKKMGFGIPLGAWFRGSLRGQLEARLLDAGSPLQDLARPGALERLLASHSEGRRDLGHQLWCLWMLDIWLRRERSASKVTR